MNKEFYTVTEVVRMTGVSKQAIHKRIKARRVAVQKFGRTLVIKARDLKKLTQ